MARIRTIKPEFWTSEQVAECSTTARLLFIGLWNFADDNGVHPDSARRIKMEVFPADEISIEDIGSFVNELVENRLLLRYEVDDASWLMVTGWHKHQRIEKPNARHPLPEGSKNIPRPVDDSSPPETETETERETEKETDGRTERNGNGRKPKGRPLVARPILFDEFHEETRGNARELAKTVDPGRKLLTADRVLCLQFAAIQAGYPELKRDLTAIVEKLAERHRRGSPPNRPWGWLKSELIRTCNDHGPGYDAIIASIDPRLTENS